jgi:transposase
VCFHSSGTAPAIAILSDSITLFSERHLMERIDYDLLFRLLVGLVLNDSEDDSNDDNLGENLLGKKLCNETHESTTHTDAKLFKKKPQ